MKKILLSALLMTGCLTLAVPQHAYSNCSSSSSKCQKYKNHHSKVADQVFEMYQKMGSELTVNEVSLNKLFTKDVKMIVNGKARTEGRDQLKAHFEKLISKVQKINYTLHEKIIAKDKVVLRYASEVPEKATIHTIAILKFRKGKVYEINKVRQFKFTHKQEPVPTQTPAA